MWPGKVLMRVVARAHATFRSGPRRLPSNPLYVAFRLYRALPCALNIAELTVTGPEQPRTGKQDEPAEICRSIWIFRHIRTGASLGEGSAVRLAVLW